VVSMLVLGARCLLFVDPPEEVLLIHGVLADVLRWLSCYSRNVWLVLSD